jgi:adenine/guanine phosphoribosyltransferase-like PRPP-binding protein
MLPLRTVGGSYALDSDALLSQASATRDSVYLWLAEECRRSGASLVVGLESWGYLFAAPTALATNIGLAVARRRVDRLEDDAVVVAYDMNSKSGNTIGMERSSVPKGSRALLVDDSVISGRTLGAVASVVEQLGGTVTGACAVVGIANRRQEAQRVLPATLGCYAWI